MDKEKRDKLEELRNVKSTAEKDLKRENEEDKVVQNVISYGKIQLTRRDSGEKDSFDLYTIEIYDYQNDEINERIYLDGQEVDMGELIRTYEDINPIRDAIDKAKEEQEKNTDDNKIESLNELEEEERVGKFASVAGKDEKDVKKIIEFEEKEKEQDKEDEKEVDSKKFSSVNSLQEIRANTKVNNYETLSKVLGMPDVSKFVVVYSEDAAEISKNNGENRNRNNSNYSIIAVKKDGTLINIDDKLELSRSEGTNSIEGRIQTDADGFTKEEYHQASIYNIKGTNKALSLENDNYGEIQVYYGSMTKGALENEGNKFVGTQLETRNVWPTSREVRGQEDYGRGNYNADNKAEETKKHLDHGDGKVPVANSDGKKNTVEKCETVEERENDVIPDTNTTWREFANMCGYRGEDAIERAKEEFEKYQKDYPDASNEEVIEEIQEEIENEMPGPDRNRR